MADRMPSALTRAGPNVRNTVNNNKLMAGYYGGRYQQQQQQMLQQQQNPNSRQPAQQQQQQYPKHQQYQNRKSPSSFNENSMDAILTCTYLVSICYLNKSERLCQCLCIFNFILFRFIGIIDGVYPMPEVVIFRRDFNGTNPYALKIFQIEVSLLSS